MQLRLVLIAAVRLKYLSEELKLIFQVTHTTPGYGEEKILALIGIKAFSAGWCCSQN